MSSDAATVRVDFSSDPGVAEVAREIAALEARAKETADQLRRKRAELAGKLFDLGVTAERTVTVREGSRVRVVATERPEPPAKPLKVLPEALARASQSAGLSPEAAARLRNVVAAASSERPPRPPPRAIPSRDQATVRPAK